MWLTSSLPLILYKHLLEAANVLGILNQDVLLVQVFDGAPPVLGRARGTGQSTQAGCFVVDLRGHRLLMNSLTVKDSS
jgi:hypothetical protein